MQNKPPPSVDLPPTIDWKQFADLPEVLPSWLIKDVLPTGSLICLYGKRGQGKTFLALDWACCVATGTDWQGRKVRRGRVAFLLAERPSGLGRRLRGWINHVGMDEKTGGAKLETNGIRWLLFGQQRFALDNEAERNRLIELLKQEFPQVENSDDPIDKSLSLLVMDPLVFFMNGSENETRDMQRFIDGALDLVNQIGCSILLVHHEGKGNHNNMLGARGSSALEAGMDTVVYLSPKGMNDVAELEITKQREAPALDEMYLHFKEQEHNGKRRGIFPTLTYEPPIPFPAPSKQKRQEEAKKKNEEKSKRKVTEGMAMMAIRALNSKEEKITVSTITEEISGETDEKSEFYKKTKREVRAIIIDLCSESKLYIEKKGSGRSSTIYTTDAPEPKQESPAVTSSSPTHTEAGDNKHTSSVNAVVSKEVVAEQEIRSGSESDLPQNGDESPSSVDHPMPDEHVNQEALPSEPPPTE